LECELLPKRKVVPFSSYISPGKDWKFLEFMKSVVSNFKIWALKNIWIIGESLEKV
jgi:hypothetical protein